jgi:hypothetical protein
MCLPLEPVALLDPVPGLGEATEEIKHTLGASTVSAQTVFREFSVMQSQPSQKETQDNQVENENENEAHSTPAANSQQLRNDLGDPEQQGYEAQDSAKDWRLTVALPSPSSFLTFGPGDMLAGQTSSDGTGGSYFPPIWQHPMASVSQTNQHQFQQAQYPPTLFNGQSPEEFFLGNMQSAPARHATRILPPTSMLLNGPSVTSAVTEATTCPSPWTQRIHQATTSGDLDYSAHGVRMSPFYDTFRWDAQGVAQPAPEPWDWMGQSRTCFGERVCKSLSPTLYSLVLCCQLDHLDQRRYNNPTC